LGGSVALNSLADRGSVNDQNLVITTYSALFDASKDERVRLLSSVTSDIGSLKDSKMTEEMFLKTIVDKMSKKHKSLTSDPMPSESLPAKQINHLT
jgi:hypothetical protein